MLKQVKMNILVITQSAWDDRIAGGNTLSNLFEEWDDSQFSCIYSRDAAPNNSVCHNYYSVSPIGIVKNLFRPSRIGRRFNLVHKSRSLANGSKEKKAIDITKNHRLLFEFFYHCIYSIQSWNNLSFRKFIEDNNPDIVFCFGQCAPLTYYTLKYIKQNTKAKVISYYVDDNFCRRVKLFSVVKRQNNKYLMGIAQLSDLCYGITQRMCDEYSELYHKPFHLLYKGCKVTVPKIAVNTPIKFVYAGNLLYQRDKTLGFLAKTIASVNTDSIKARLDIYSGTTVSNDVRSMLNIIGTSALHSALPYEEIKKIMMAADVVLHVESFDSKQMELVRLSFSTKITDCMQSGAMMMAIGPNGIASIDYANNVPGCVVVNNLANLQSEISRIVSNPATIIKNATLTNDYALANIEIGKRRNHLRKEFNSLISQY